MSCVIHSGLSTEEQLQSSLAESLIMKDLKHPHVLGLLGVCFDTPEHSPYIILPFMANGSVKNFLRGRRVHPTNFDDFPVVCYYYSVKSTINTMSPY